MGGRAKLVRPGLEEEKQCGEVVRMKAFEPVSGGQVARVFGAPLTSDNGYARSWRQLTAT